ncbi:hypothetical protein INT43_002378 [Umbelopsis isabellina]|uniref:Uncharacterized protein n=1 Tax=Mortierella isabellina TaxID=91625 RepID=A0A8H7Q5Z7_MORIS|nr:hypothetical protein INT43_002378 [Umbelopsis isabellina]
MLLRWLLVISSVLVLLAAAAPSASVSSDVHESSLSMSSASTPASLVPSLATSTPPLAPPVPTNTVNSGGFSDDARGEHDQQNWLQQHSRWVFVLVIGLLVAAAIIYYVVRGIRRARRTLKSENEKLASLSMHPPKYEEAAPRY